MFTCVSTAAANKTNMGKSDFSVWFSEKFNCLYLLTTTASSDLQITTLMSCSVFNLLECWSGSCKFVFFTDLLFKRTKRWEDLSHVESRLLVVLFSTMMNDVFCSWLPPGWTRVNKQDRKWLSYTFFPAEIWSEQRCSHVFLASWVLKALYNTFTMAVAADLLIRSDTVC